MKLVGGLYAVSKGGKHDGHEVRIQEKGIYCLTCDKFYPRTPPNTACTCLPQEERKMELRQYARDNLGMTDEQVDVILSYSKSIEQMESEIRQIQGGIRTR